MITKHEEGLVAMDLRNVASVEQVVSEWVGVSFRRLGFGRGVVQQWVAKTRLRRRGAEPLAPTTASPGTVGGDR